MSSLVVQRAEKGYLMTDLGIRLGRRCLTFAVLSYAKQVSFLSVLNPATIPTLEESIGHYRNSQALHIRVELSNYCIHFLAESCLLDYSTCIILNVDCTSDSRKVPITAQSKFLVGWVFEVDTQLKRSLLRVT